ncbi:hypothetical protein [Vannielia litorea]|uniref:hypothetical protein n=1 Tax=Vannielia litorea TaxID=1217970 RepID=UPI001C94B201|nr:hypothetical protein [Vannielia litorea]MBY6046871.1 hypothetical protein [Vannielia litorea]MBY6074285.1 hypothetical protein [Vannielia litorea]
MKRLMMTVAAVAMTAGTAFAMTPEQLRDSVDASLTEYAPEVEAETLTDDQVRQVYVVVNDSGKSPAEKSGAIGEIIEGTNAEYYADLADGDIDLELDVNNMREILQAKLDIGGYDHDVSELSDEEVASLAQAFNNGNTPAEIDAAVASYFDS